MAGNTYGTLYKITTYGESHGKALGVVIDGCPSGFELDLSHIHTQLQRRKPGQSAIVTQRKEEEEFEILSGMFEGLTTGTPLSIVIRNTDQRQGITIRAYVDQVGHITMPTTSTLPTMADVDESIVRCPDREAANSMIEYIKAVKKKGDTVGGAIKCVIAGCPVGLGEPVFDKLHAELGKAMLSINAVKGFEIGSGFAAIEKLGSEHNDEFYEDQGSIKTKTNYSGGIQGGISNGMDINMRVAFKPVATIIQSQTSVDSAGQATTVTGRGRHDPCVVPRAVPIVESMAAIVILDMLLRNKVIKY